MSEHTTNAEGVEGLSRTPPYIAFSTLLTLLKAFKADSVPPQIDRSVLSKFSGGIQNQLKMALRSLDLMDADSIPTPHLHKLAEAYETPAFAEVLAERLHATYPYVFKLDLMSATPTMFADAFKNGTNAKEDVLRKCRTFFLYAAKDAGISLGNRLATGTVPRSTNGSSRRKTKAKPSADHEQSPPSPPPPAAVGQITDKALEYKLIDLMKDGAIGQPERDAIWVLVQYLAAKAVNGESPK